jgi:hypothetical protein
MRVTTVESTVLATVGYDGARQLLQVEFCGRAIYRYFGVPASSASTAAECTIEGQLLQSGDPGTISFLPDL